MSPLTPFAESVRDVRAAVTQARNAGQRIGLVPTMGALHRGHTALIAAARRDTEFVVVSIFVNPTQFGPSEDFARYPRQMEADRQACAEAGAHLIFAPPPAEMYPPNFTTWVEVTGLQDVLCGPSRPGHFRGVATVVLKLFNIVLPDVAVFGQKDAQQTRLIRQMVDDLNVPVQVVIEPTVREADGLALSSRNRYLSPEQRAQAVVLSQALSRIQESVRHGEYDVAHLEAILTDTIASAPDARIDYTRILDADTLRPIERVERPALAAVAVFFGATRLIDNVILHP